MLRLRRTIGWLLVVVIAIFLVSLLGANLYVQSQTTQQRIQQELSQRLKMPLQIQRISVTPWGGLNLSGITIPQLSDAADPADSREAAEAIRVAGDAGLTMLIQDGLYNTIPSVRTHSVELLATLGGTRVLKPLIEAFHAAAVPTIPPYQVGYVTTLTGQIARLTGQDYYFYARRTGRAPEIAAAMVTWWNENMYRFPQLGEAPVDPHAPNATQLVRQARALVLVHRDFGGANLPQEVAPQLTPDDATVLLNSVNGIPRASDNSFTDRLNTAQEPAVPKIPDDALSAPGKWREELQAERLREERAR